MTSVTEQLAAMLAANAAQLEPDDPEMIAGDLGLRPVFQVQEETVYEADICRRAEADMQTRFRAAVDAQLDPSGPEAYAAQVAWAEANAHLCTGRSGAGRVRNFRAMNPVKFHETLQAVRREANDPEALRALEEEEIRRRYA